MELHGLKMKRLIVKKIMTFLVLWCLGGWLIPVTPALGQGLAALMEKPAAPEEKKEEAPSICGPLVSDGIPLDPGVITKNWRTVSAGGNLGTFNMPLKETYSVMKNWESYAVVPFRPFWESSRGLNSWPRTNYPWPRVRPLFKTNAIPGCSA